MDIFIIITLAALVIAVGMAWLARVVGDSGSSIGEHGILPANLGRDDFILLIREHYAGQGFALRENPTGGADFEIERDGHRQLVDFVEHPDPPLGEAAVREFHAKVAARKAGGGILVSAGRFTPQARELARSRHIDLIDGVRLRQLVEAARDTTGELTAPRAVADDESTVPRRVVLCPVCGRTMIKRFERRDGENHPYYGCVHAPHCKGRRDIA